MNNVHRIEGVYGKSFKNKSRGTYTFSDGKELSFEINGYTEYNLSELGCTLSHLYAIKTAYENGDEYAIVCEDDIYFGIANMWDFDLEYVINNAPAGWGLLQLYSFHNYNKDIDVYTKWDYNYSALAYLVNRKCMKLICDSLFVGDKIIINQMSYISNGAMYQSITADYFIYKYIQNFLGVYVTKPLFISNNLLGSTIDHDQLEHLSYSMDVYTNVYKNKAERFMNNVDAKKSKIVTNDLKIIEGYQV